MIYGCLQPRELWFIDFNHVQVQMYIHVGREVYTHTHVIIHVHVCVTVLTIISSNQSMYGQDCTITFCMYSTCIHVYMHMYIPRLLGRGESVVLAQCCTCTMYVYM